ncbi:MAG TPA: beta/gamma crystallin-related protein [Candidatus Polarisedimenticolaceae bacterium]|nr:beta/gamma crystallin-related protein [Candidatus Polarisedimenticolaceae bacterium]
MMRIARPLCVLAPVILAPCLAHAGLTVWRDKNQNGPSQQVDHAVPDLRKISFDDQISSLSADEPWLVCSEPRYRGECRVIDGTVDNLHGSGMNDRISSARPAPQGRAQGWERRYGRLDGSSNARNDSPYDPRRDARYDSGTRSSIRVFEHEDYRGTSQVFDRPIGNLANFGLANQITSVQIAGGDWQACSAANFAGECVVLHGNDDDLGTWSDRIVSLRPAGSPNPWAPPPSSTHSSIRVFEHEDYRGTSQVFDRPIANLANFGLANQITSVQIAGGDWQACTAPNYGGPCMVLRGNDDDLGSWSDRIVSLRPVGSPAGSQTTWGGVPTSSLGSRILVFADRDFEGTSRMFDHAVPDLARFGLADQVTSLRVEGGGSWEVCTEAGYRGECKVFRDSDQFLGRWSDTIVSLRPVPDEER